MTSKNLEKFSPAFYKVFIQLLKPDVYRSILSIRHKTNIPEYGIVTWRTRSINGELLLHAPEVKQILEGHYDLLYKLVDSLIKKYHLDTGHRLFIILFVVFDVESTPAGIVSPAIEYKIREKNDKPYLELKIKPYTTQEEYSRFSKRVILPFKEGSFKEPRYKSITKEHFQIYYWLVLRKIKPLEYVHKFYKVDGVTIGIKAREIGFIARDMKRIMSLL